MNQSVDIAIVIDSANKISINPSFRFLSIGVDLIEKPGRNILPEAMAAYSTLSIVEQADHR